MRSEFKTIGRILTFQATAEEFRGLNHRHLIIGLLLTWIVGIGRWWEDPRASLLQHTGIGSVVYVFILALFLWLILWPLAPGKWNYFNVLTFIALTSPPAILYALPVRHGFDLATAQTIRLWMLAIVAGWRIALLAFYLMRGAGFSGLRTSVATLFPLICIVFALTALNLEKVVFEFMGGMVAQEKQSVNDSAYAVLFLLTMLSELLLIPVGLAYLGGSLISISEKIRARKRGAKT